MATIDGTSGRGEQMRPMSMAPGGRVSVLAKIREALAQAYPHYSCGCADLYAGLFVVVRDTSPPEGERDPEWSLAGPFGHCLGGDGIFEGWWPLPGGEG